MTSLIYHSRQANDILSTPVVFIFSNHKSEGPFAMRGSRHFVRCNVEVSPIMKAVGWSFFHWGDRCDRLTRPESTGCLLKVVTSLLQAPQSPLTPLWTLSDSPRNPSAPPRLSLTETWRATVVAVHVFVDTLVFFIITDPGFFFFFFLQPPWLFVLIIHHWFFHYFIRS